MNRWLQIGSLAILLISTTGCLHHNVRKGCDNGVIGKMGSCGAGCNTCSGSCGGTGILGRIGGMCGVCSGGCRADTCTPGPIGWAQGGHDYSAHLQAGPMGHNAPMALNNRPFTPGPPTAQVAYPYYTVRGPRDFLAENPPTIGR